MLGTWHKPQPTSSSLLKVSFFKIEGSMISNLMSGRGFDDFQLSWKILFQYWGLDCHQTICITAKYIYFVRKVILKVEEP